MRGLCHDARVDLVRPAATIMVVRQAWDPGDRPGGVEVIVLRRSETSRFAPGFVVFPGGRVEPVDDRLAMDWFGDPAERARACAVRELAEETGLVLTRDGLVEAPGLPGAAGLRPPDPASLREVARWIAPEFLPVRFDARFFALAVGDEATPRPDGVETDRAWWGRPKEVLDQAVAGRFPLMWPTLKMLEALGGCPSVRDVLDLRVDQVAPPVGAPPLGRA
jgi:8-oxo-dGTP pyrophosphatase MutT (NUDIX family)